MIGDHSQDHMDTGLTLKCDLHERLLNPLHLPHQSCFVSKSLSSIYIYQFTWSYVTWSVILVQRSTEFLRMLTWRWISSLARVLSSQNKRILYWKKKWATDDSFTSSEAPIIEAWFCVLFVCVFANVTRPIPRAKYHRVLSIIASRAAKSLN